MWNILCSMTNETIPVELKSAEQKEQSAVLAKMLPLSLLFFVVLIDQITKFLVIENIPVVVDRVESAYSFFGDFSQKNQVHEEGAAVFDSIFSREANNFGDFRVEGTVGRR